MRVLCKRSFFEKNTNFYPINNKEYGEDWIKWKRGKYYHSRMVKDYERGANTEMFPGIYLHIETELKDTWSPITEKNFNKYFYNVDEIRNLKIDNIIS